MKSENLNYFIVGDLLFILFWV